jgi:tRNA A37 methylthiotransferase MiaB
LAGTELEVLVEGPSKAAQKRAAANGGIASDEVVQLVGRSTHDHIVVFDGPRTLIGQILPVRIEKVDAFTLFARV